MHSSLKIIIMLCGITALSSCGESSTVDKSEKNGVSSGREEIILRIAHTSESAGDFAGAEKQYKQAVSQSGNSIETRMELVEFYQRHHGDRQAIGVLNDALRIQPDNVVIMRELANAYINESKPDEALEAINKAIVINNKDAFLYNTQGVALDMTGKYADAQKAYKTALLLSPDDAITFKINLSMSYILSGSYDRAVQLLLPLMDTPEASATLRQNLALAYGMEGKSDEALKLGLKDLSTSEAQENLKFYRMLAAKHKNHKQPAQAKDTISPETTKELFPEEEAPEEETVQSQPVIKTIIPTEKSEPIVSSPNTTQPLENFELPAPTLKPDRIQ